jgi:PAS domain S-box-containing protein
MLGYSREDLVAGKIHWDLITPPEWLKAAQQALQELQDSGRAHPYEKQYVRKDGSRGLALFAAWRIAEDEAVVYIIDVAQKNFSQTGG